MVASAQVIEQQPPVVLTPEMVGQLRELFWNTTPAVFNLPVISGHGILFFEGL